MDAMAVTERTAPTALLAAMAKTGRQASQALEARPARQVVTELEANLGLVGWPVLLVVTARPASAGLEANPGRQGSAGPQAQCRGTAGAAPSCSSNVRTASGATRST